MRCAFFVVVGVERRPCISFLVRAHCGDNAHVYFSRKYQQTDRHSNLGAMALKSSPSWLPQMESWIYPRSWCPLTIEEQHQLFVILATSRANEHLASSREWRSSRDCPRCLMIVRSGKDTSIIVPDSVEPESWTRRSTHVPVTWIVCSIRSDGAQLVLVRYTSGICLRHKPSCCVLSQLCFRQYEVWS